MGFSSHYITFHFISLLLPVLCSSFSSSSTNVKASALINEICSKTRNPTLCFQVFKSSGNANLGDLGQTAIESAQTSGFLAADTIQVLIKQGREPVLKQRFLSCAGSYGSANRDIAESRTLLKSGSYKVLLSKATIIVTEAAACDKNFVKPPSEPAELKHATQNFQDVTSIVLVVAKRLAGQK